MSTSFVLANSPLPALKRERVEQIAGWFSGEPGAPIPSFDDRPFWETAAKSESAQQHRLEAEAWIGKPPPDLTETLFNEFRAKGVRSNFDSAYSTRLAVLRRLVLAEGLEGKERFLPDIERYMAAILAEPSWIIAAHAGKRSTWHDTYDLVDLGAAARIWTLATTDWLLGERLDAALRRKLRKEARERVFRPYLERVRNADRRDFFWMNASDNWAAVCSSGVLGAALILVDSPLERAEIAAAFEAYAPAFIGGFGDDGYCFEGHGYWEFGFGHFLIASELLRQATGGRVDLLGDPKVRRIALAGRRLEITDQIYPAFGDMRLEEPTSSWIRAFIEARFGSGQAGGEPSYTAMRLYQTTFDLTLPRGSHSRLPSQPLPLRDWFPDGGVLVARPPDGNAGLAVALKAGHNGVPHNHNDIGSFVVVVDGQRILPDLGADLPYTAQSFGQSRYENPLNNSFGHPVPKVAGQLQRAGKEAAGKTVMLDFLPQQDRWQIDMAAAYDVPALKSLTRTFIYSRSGRGSLEVIDTVSFAHPQSFGTAVILQPGQSYEVLEEGRRVRVRSATGSKGVMIRCEIESEAELAFSEEPLYGFDKRQGSKGTRLGFDLSAPAREASIRLTISPE